VWSALTAKMAVPAKHEGKRQLEDRDVDGRIMSPLKKCHLSVA
jgi:hypothetical protein